MADSGKRGGKPSRIERADRQINAGHSRALDVALAKTESKIRILTTERLYAFDKNGKEIAHSSSGTKNSTSLPSSVNIKDAILTHNHPGAGLDKTTVAGRIGRSFSGTDIATAIGGNAAEMRAVTGTYTYSIKRPKNGWGVADAKKAKKIGNEINTKMNKYYRENVSQAEKAYYDGKISFNQLKTTRNRADVAAVNRTLRETSKKYGYDYSRKRTV